nr:glycosyltransferase [Sporichthyaceae bacterium]
MPLISVVVPIYNVERYLADCLESLAQQTHGELEVILVDDGSTDSSADVARTFADRDPRFRLVQQPNGGLGNARNTGADLATGDYLAFVDSDDVVVRNAYELMGGSLEKTGSDFASGNYHRLTVTGTWQSAMVAGAFRANRLRTHVSKHEALLNDRTAWNKLFRRSFWTRHQFRWPEGVLYEDIPVTLPAHVLARSVDVLRQPVYLWRARVGDSSSITQRRTEARAIRDRTRAVDGVSRFLADHGEHALKSRYDRSVAEQDLGYFLSQLDVADDEFRSLFLEVVNDYFDRADDDVFDHLPAIRRLEWHLVRRRLLPELLEVLRFEKSGEINWTPMVRKGRRFWGDYPFRGDPELAIPDSVYRLDREEIPLRASVEDVFWQGDQLTLTGYAHIAFLDLSRPGSARIRLTLEESGHPENVVSMKVRTVRRPDVTESAPDGVTCYDWCGFEATAPVSELAPRGRYRDGHWRLRVEVRSHGILRRRWLARTEPGRAKRPALKTVGGVRVVPTSEVGDFAVEVSAGPATVTDVVVDGPVLELHGTLHGRSLDPGACRLRAARRDGTATLHYPAAAAGPPSPDG